MHVVRHDEDDNWLGTWSTTDDIMLETLANEDRGVQIEGIDMLAMFDNTNNVQTLEEQSFKSYKTAAGLENAPQQEEEAIPAGSAAASSVMEGSSGAAG